MKDELWYFAATYWSSEDRLTPSHSAEEAAEIK